ncbi:unnamed protein product, partial [Discosporangium mesarthrocarpum]
MRFKRRLFRPMVPKISGGPTNDGPPIPPDGHTKQTTNLRPSTAWVSRVREPLGGSRVSINFSTSASTSAPLVSDCTGQGSGTSANQSQAKVGLSGPEGKPEAGAGYTNNGIIAGGICPGGSTGKTTKKFLVPRRRPSAPSTSTSASASACASPSGSRLKCRGDNNNNSSSSANISARATSISNSAIASSDCKGRGRGERVRREVAGGEAGTPTGII